MELAADNHITQDDLLLLQPFIKLYIEFIKENYPEEYEVSSVHLAKLVIDPNLLSLS